MDAFARLQDLDVRFEIERARHVPVPDGFGIQSLCAVCWTPLNEGQRVPCPGLRTLDRLLEEEVV